MLWISLGWDIQELRAAALSGEPDSSWAVPLTLGQHCSTRAAATSTSHSWVARGVKTKPALKPHQRLPVQCVSLWCKGRVSRKPARNFPVGFFLFQSTWREPRPQEAAQLKQQLNHSPGHQISPKMNFSESSPFLGSPLNRQIPLAEGLTLSTVLRVSKHPFHLRISGWFSPFLLHEPPEWSKKKKKKMQPGVRIIKKLPACY